MKITRLLLALSYVPLAAGQSVTTVPFTESSSAVGALSGTGRLTLPAIRVQLEIRYPHGNQERGNLVVVYDPTTGRYFWRYTPVFQTGDTGSFLDAMKAGQEEVFAGPSELVDFHILGAGAVFVKEHKERAESLAAAERASVEQITQGLGAYERTGYHTDAKAIPTGVSWARSFGARPIRQIVTTRITGLSQSRGRASSGDWFLGTASTPK